MAGYLRFEVRRTQRDLTIPAQVDVPLLEAISNVQEYGLRRRLAFERWFGALNSAQANQEIIVEASNNYADYSEKLRAELARVCSLIQAIPSDIPARDTIVEIRTLLDQVDLAYPNISGRQQALLKLQKSGQSAEANQQVNLLNDVQRQLQTQREIIADKMDGPSQVLLARLPELRTQSLDANWDGTWQLQEK